MFMTTDTTAALARARNDTLDLVAAKSGDTTKAADDGKVGGLLESLSAVIPTGIAAVYTVFATMARTEMLERGAEERAEYQAAQLALEPPPTRETIAKHLEDLPLESKDLMVVRWGVLGLAFVVAFWLAFQAVRSANAASSKKRPIWRLLFEPLTAVVALSGWALAVPGTPLGAYLDSGDLGFTVAGIGVAAALLLLGFGTKLREPSKSS